MQLYFKPYLFLLALIRPSLYKHLSIPNREASSNSPPLTHSQKHQSNSTHFDLSTSSTRNQLHNKMTHTLVLFLLLTLTTAHSASSCPCVCRSLSSALPQLKSDCASGCSVRFCSDAEQTGIACCTHSDDELNLASSPSPEPEITPTPEYDEGMAKIHFASDNRSELFINGLSVATVLHPSAVATVTWMLEKGDVLSIRAKDTGKWHGVIVAIEMEDDLVVTGSGMWKARRAFQDKGRYFQWTTKDYNSCSWPKAMTVTDGVIGEGMSRGFPYDTGAKYVWAVDSGEFHGVFLRMVWGGEECPVASTESVE